MGVKYKNSSEFKKIKPNNIFNNVKSMFEATSAKIAHDSPASWMIPAPEFVEENFS